MQQRKCVWCKAKFEARSSRAEYCSNAHRQAASRKREKEALVVKPKKKRTASPSREMVLDLVKAVRTQVSSTPDDPLSQIALLIADRLVKAEDASLSGVAALTRELRSVLAQHMARTLKPPAGTPNPEPDKVTVARGASNVALFRSRRAAAQDS